MKALRFIHLCLGLSLLVSCGPQVMQVEVQVKEKFSEAAVDSAEVVVFRQAIGGTAQRVMSCMTGAEGSCTMNFEVDEQYVYSIEASRQHFVNPVSENGVDYLHKASLELDDSSQVTLFLEAIQAPDPERFEKMYPEVPISQVVAAISADEWSWSFLPKISWNDVPILLNQGNDSTFIKNYPRNLRSRYRPDSVRAGLAALWLIEALRKQQVKNQEFFRLEPPSRAPVLGTRKGNPSGFNSTDQILQAHDAYALWWKEMPADSSARADAIKENPLAGIGLSWM